MPDKYGAIIGGSYPNHFIIIDLNSEKLMENKIYETDNDFTPTSEVKIAFMSCQIFPIGTSPNLTVYGLPQF